MFETMGSNSIVNQRIGCRGCRSQKLLLFARSFILCLFLTHNASVQASVLKLLRQWIPRPWESLNDQKLRVAVCLVGGARDFELTGPSIVKNLLEPYYADGNASRVDLFVNSPLDERSYKLWALSEAKTVTAFRIYSNSDMKENTSLEMFDWTQLWRPQSVLQYLRLVEGCLPLIQAHELEQSFKYDLILRTRVDAYWYGPPPPLRSYNLTRYSIPDGSHWSGYNDRFGVGGRYSNQVALSRLTMLPLLKRAGYRKLNSEKAFKAQLELAHVDADLINVNFCILTRQKTSGLIRPILSISSKAPLNGAKCRPCTNRTTGKRAERQIRARGGPQRWEGWYGPIASRVDICFARQDWEMDWQAEFDRQAGARLARQRRRVTGTGLGEGCVRELQKLKSKVAHWLAPSPHSLCTRAKLGRASVMGRIAFEYVTFTRLLSRSSVVYLGSMHSGWMQEMWVREVRLEKKLPRRVFFQVGKVLAKVSKASTRESRGYAMAHALNAFFAKKKHNKIDLLKLSDSGNQLAMLDAWIKGFSSPRICQLLVRYPESEGGETAAHSFSTGLQRLDFQLDKCIRFLDQHSLRCTYFSNVDCF